MRVPASAPLSTTTAVLVVVFNRADCAGEVLRAIGAARPRRVYLAGDGARPHVPGEAVRCEETWQTAVRAITWPCDVRPNRSAVNLGPDERMASAISWVFAHEPQAMIFEDDCVPHPTFFPFCDELLERYASETRVGMITGCQFVRGGWRCRDDASYAFARLTQIWGWGTWRRAWANYDPAMRDWPAARAGDLLRRTFRRQRDRKFWLNRFDECHSGARQIWDYKWAFKRWQLDQLGIAPAQNLVSNIGFRPDATHTNVTVHPCAAVPLAPMRFPLRHPTAIAPDDQLDRRTAQLLFTTGSLRARAAFRLRQFATTLSRPFRR